MGDIFIHSVVVTSTLVGWLILLPPGIGWDIMWYKSDTLPSYLKLSNCSYYVMLITPNPRLRIRFIYRVLIPTLHQPPCLWQTLRLRGQFIYGAVGHPFRYGFLSPLDVHHDGVKPRSFHCLHNQWVLPLSASPMFLCHLPDPLRCPMLKPLQDLEHIPGHHPDLTSI